MTFCFHFRAVIAICSPSGVTNILLWVEGLWVEGLVRRKSRFVCEGSRGS